MNTRIVTLIISLFVVAAVVGVAGRVIGSGIGDLLERVPTASSEQAAR